MRTAKDWKEFEVIDTSDGEKLERWGDVVLVRPDPQVIWNTPKGESWRKANAHYLRSSSGGGRWEIRSMSREQWTIGYKQLRFKISPTGFKHTGLFPEQAVNWDFMADKMCIRDRCLPSCTRTSPRTRTTRCPATGSASRSPFRLNCKKKAVLSQNFSVTGRFFDLSQKRKADENTASLLRNTGEFAMIGFRQLQGAAAF